MYKNLHDYEEAARAYLPASTYDYYAGGSDDEWTLARNSTAFQRLALCPRVLTDVSTVSLATSVLGTPVSSPILVAPTAYAALAHDDAECGIVQAAGALGLVAVVSINANRSLEAIMAATPRRDLLWQQLYLYDRAFTRDLLARIEAAGYRAIVLTVDRPRLARRERDMRNSFQLPATIQAANFAGSAILPRQHDCPTTWADIAWLRAQTSLPILLKGILSAEDARLAVEHGVAGLIVSNHGGRQLDGCITGIEALPTIARAVDGRCELYVDGGIRRGTDVVKALALGACAVLIGRPVLWGLAVDSAQGVQGVLSMLRDELELAMALSGCASIDSISPKLLSFA